MTQAEVLGRYDVHQPVPTAAQMRALRPWTLRLRQVFEADTVAGKAERADALLVAADCRPRLVSHRAGQPFHFHYAPVRKGLAARVKALTAAGLAHVIDEGGGSRLRRCSLARLRRRLHRHLPQRPPPLLQRPMRQPGQRGQSPAAPAPATGGCSFGVGCGSR